MAKLGLVREEVIAILKSAEFTPAQIARVESAVEDYHRARGFIRRDLDEITVSSGVSSQTGAGFVDLSIDQTRTQMEVKKAIEVATMIFGAAGAAESDAAFTRLLRERIGIDDPQRVAMVLLDLREMRQGTRDTSNPH